MNLKQLFDASFAGHRDAVALEFRGATYTFGDIDSRSNRLAALLRAKGLATGDRLCCYLSNSVEMIDLYLACVKSGVIFVPINILYRGREIAHILADSKPKALVSTPIDCDVEVWDPVALSIEAASYPNVRPNVVLDGDSPAGIIYTSGTTGTAKGAVLTHNNFAVNAMNVATSWQITSKDRLLLALPLFHVHGLGNGIHAWLLSGCRVRLLERFDHATAAEEFLDFRPTVFFGVPAMYVRMNDWSSETARAIGENARLFVSGSAPLSVQTHQDFYSRFGHTILERYGMSETLMNIGNPYYGERRAGTIGFPFPGVSAKIVDGELHLKGSNIFAGYWGREEATKAVFVDGWFKTGDIATCSDDGYYTLCGRRSDLIISGGFNIYPREIEEFLEEHAEVAEAAVVARPDRVRGEVPVAFFAGTADTSSLKAACRDKLASFKVPRDFIRVDKLPRNALGKVQKHLLNKPAN